MTARVRLPQVVAGLVLGALMLASSICSADWERSDRAPVDRPVNSIHSGATSIQFLTFGGGYQTPAFRTSGIYFKTHFSDRGALRVGAEFNFDESSRNAPPPQLTNISHVTNYSVSVSAEIDEYVDATGPVTVFVGVGPYWARSRYTDENTRYDLYNNLIYFSSSKSDSKSWEVGGSAGAGFEWFFKRKLSLIGRVGGSFGFGRRLQTNEYTYDDPYGTRSGSDRVKASTATASTSSAALGLGVYF